MRGGVSFGGIISRWERKICHPFLLLLWCWYLDSLICSIDCCRVWLLQWVNIWGIYSLLLFATFLYDAGILPSGSISAKENKTYTVHGTSSVNEGCCSKVSIAEMCHWSRNKINHLNKRLVAPAVFRLKYSLVYPVNLYALCVADTHFAIKIRWYVLSKVLKKQLTPYEFDQLRSSIHV